MIPDENSIVVTVRSFVPALHPPAGYIFGEPFQMELPNGITAQELAARILAKNIDQLGITAINGKAAPGHAVLSQGDRVDLFALIEGG
jgi:sulfur carrier protein ThiS